MPAKPDREPGLLSIVVPCLNESSGLLRFHARLAQTTLRVPIAVEILYVNDGSVDDTINVLQGLRAADSRIGLLDLSRNFGKEAALTAGIDHANGDAVIVLDSDLQDPPECIPDMVAAWRDGYDVVAMKRADRSSDTAFKRITAALFYSLLGKLVDIEHTGDVDAAVADHDTDPRRTVQIHGLDGLGRVLVAVAGEKELGACGSCRRLGDAVRDHLRSHGAAADEDAVPRGVHRGHRRHPHLGHRLPADDLQQAVGDEHLSPRDGQS